MNELFSNQPGDRDIEKQKIREKVALAKELSERGEVFAFDGLVAEVYEEIKNSEIECPGFATPIDELIERCKIEGIKVILGKHPESGNIFILPSQSNDIENDNLFPRHLQVSDTMDEGLKRLILMDKGD